jgi:hypothetical protein
MPSLAKTRPTCQTNSLEPVDGRFKFQKRGQLFVRPHNEMLSVVAMRVSNPDRSPARIKG